MAAMRSSSRRLSVLQKQLVPITGEDESDLFSPSPCSVGPPGSRAHPRRILIANRGEIACRIHRAAHALGFATLGVFTEEDSGSLHCGVLDKVIKLPSEATPVAPYLNATNLVQLAAREGCIMVHPGYGFLAESQEFAKLCEESGIRFVGPSPAIIGLFGDKVASKEAATKAGLQVLPSTPGLTSLPEAEALLAKLGLKFPLQLKASFGGGGRGQALVQQQSGFADAFRRCSKEAELAFGRPEVFIERYLPQARHIEVQVLGDGQSCRHLFERDCSVQLRKQKVIEIAPARGIAEALRSRICSAAVQLCESVGYFNAGTVEFLVEGQLADPKAQFYFLELNPRIQVEHTITEEVTGIDIVQKQLMLADGMSLAEVGLGDQQAIKLHGSAIQVRVGLQPGGGGEVRRYAEPAGVRVDSSVAQNTIAVTDYDPMIAKLIVHRETFEQALEAARAAVSSFVVEGPKWNRDFLLRLLTHADLAAPVGVHTTWVEDLKLHLGQASANPEAANRKDSSGLSAEKRPLGGAVGSIVELAAPFPGQVAEVKVAVGDKFAAGQVLLVLSAMKMLTDVVADRDGEATEILVSNDMQVNDGTLLLRFKALGEVSVEDQEAPPVVQRAAARAGAGHDTQNYTGEPQSSPASIWTSSTSTGELDALATPVLRSKAKPDDPTFQKRMAHNKGLCDELHRRLEVVRQGGGEKSVGRHRSRGKNLVRERIQKIIDRGTEPLELSALAGWEMYGGGVHSGGMVCAIGLVCGREVMFMGTDATIKGGVSFPAGYKKQLRAQEIAQANYLPCVYLIDGGGAKLDALQGSERGKGGRDTTYEGSLPAEFVYGGKQFYNQAVMSGMGIPQIAVVCGMCTAGGAYIPAMCDENIIVKENGTVYLGGPPLVKAATGEDADEQSLGGAAMHTSKSGTCDHFAPDEDTALRMCREIIENLAVRHPRHILQNCAPPEPPAFDEESILGILPESTNIPFDIREVIARLVDGSRFHEFKARYGPTLVCGWAHIEGFPVGIVGNNGMLFSEAAMKGTHFIQICGKRGTPLVFLHNVTGFIIGRTYEEGGITKDGAKMVNAVSNVPVPKFSIICGGSFGAGNYAMCGPAFGPRFVFLWPGARISVMGGEQAAGVVAIVRQNALKREGQKPMTVEQEAALKKPIIQGINMRNSAWHSTAGVNDDGIIDPRETRKVLAKAISISLNAPPEKNSYGVFRM